MQLISAYNICSTFLATVPLSKIERGICCGAGEYGHLLKDPTLREQFALLQLRFPSATTEIKASLLSAYLKMQVTRLCPGV